MIIDAHVNLDSHRYPVERALRVLAQSYIQQAVVFADPEAEDLEAQNAYVLEVSRQHDLYPFYYLGGNPWSDTRPDLLELPDQIDQYAGIRWHRWIGEALDRTGIPDHNELDWAISLMDSAEFEAFVAAAAHYALPLIFEESLAVTVEFALRYPSLDIIVPHMGAYNGGETNILRALWDVPNVYLGTSLAPLSEITFSRVGVERIIFGSGFPYGNPEAELEKIERLPLADTAKEAIYGENLLTLLGGYRREG